MFLPLPYQRYAHYASILLVALAVISFAFPDVWPGLIRQIGSGLAVLILLAAALNIGLMIRDIRRQELFIVRNATFYTGLLTMVAMGWFIYQDMSGNTRLFFPGWWLLPLLLFFYTQQLYRVRMDSMLLEVKLGMGQIISVPLFDLTSIKVDEASVEAMRTNGERFLLKRNYFSSGQWKILKARFEQLAG